MAENKKLCLEESLIVEGAPAIVIATISDFHGQLEPAYVFSNDGTLQEKGGISRLNTAFNKIKQQYPDKILLFGSGDYFTEDFRVGKYFAAFGGRPIACFLNDLPIEASTIGNHEFDFGMEAADKALHNLTFPLIATNLKQSDLTCKIHKKLILHKNGYTLGILGLMLPDIKVYVGLAYGIPKKDIKLLQFEQDLYGCAQAAVNDLKKQHKVDFVVVLSHLGFEEDKLLAEKVDGIDLICGGHTHTTIKKDNEFVVNKPQKGKTIIVHPSDRGLFLGVVKLWPKEKGDLKYSWDLIEIDTTFAQDQQIEDKLKYFKDLLPGSATITISTCPIDTSKYNLRTQESGFANFITDVIREHFNVDMVLLNASSIRSRAILPQGQIRENDLNNWFPFENNFLVRLKVIGKYIKQALELAVEELPQESRNFLNVSGIMYNVDTTKSKGQRVVSVLVLQKDGSLSVFDENKEYDIIINNMMIDEFFVGAFSMFKQGITLQNTGLTEKDLLIAYFKKHKEISPNKVGRIIIDKGKKTSS